MRKLLSGYLNTFLLSTYISRELSKFETIQIAKNYIRSLNDMLAETDTYYSNNQSQQQQQHNNDNNEFYVS